MTRLAYRHSCAATALFSRVSLRYLAGGRALNFSASPTVENNNVQTLFAEPPVALVDMDNTLVNWESQFERLMAQHYPQIPIVPPIERTEFKIWYANFVADVFPEFWLSMDPIPGALEAMREMVEFGVYVFIVTTPDAKHTSRSAYEKIAWIERHLGSEWKYRSILIHDKTLVKAPQMNDSDFRSKESMKAGNGGAVTITLHTLKDDYDEKAEVKVELTNPDVVVEKMLQTLANKFPPESVMTIATGAAVTDEAGSSSRLSAAGSKHTASSEISSTQGNMLSPLGPSLHLASRLSGRHYLGENGVWLPELADSKGRPIQYYVRNPKTKTAMPVGRQAKNSMGSRIPGMIFGINGTAIPGLIVPEEGLDKNGQPRPCYEGVSGRYWEAVSKDGRQLLGFAIDSSDNDIKPVGPPVFQADGTLIPGIIRIRSGEVLAGIPLKPVPKVDTQGNLLGYPLAFQSDSAKAAAYQSSTSQTFNNESERVYRDNADEAAMRGLTNIPGFTSAVASEKMQSTVTPSTMHYVSERGSTPGTVPYYMQRKTPQGGQGRMQSQQYQSTQNEQYKTFSQQTKAQPQQQQYQESQHEYYKNQTYSSPQAELSHREAFQSEASKGSTTRIPAPGYPLKDGKLAAIAIEQDGRPMNGYAMHPVTQEVLPVGLAVEGTTDRILGSGNRHIVGLQLAPFAWDNKSRQAIPHYLTSKGSLAPMALSSDGGLLHGLAKDEEGNVWPVGLPLTSELHTSSYVTSPDGRAVKGIPLTYVDPGHQQYSNHFGSERVTTTELNSSHSNNVPADSVKYIEVPMVEEKIIHVPRTEYREVEKKVPLYEYETVDKIVEVPEVQYITKQVEVVQSTAHCCLYQVPQIEEVLREIKVPQIVNVPKEIIKEVKVIETKYVEKQVEVPGEIVEVPKVQRIEQKVFSANYIDREVPTVVAQKLEPVIYEVDEAYEVPCTVTKPRMITVDVFIPKPVTSTLKFLGKGGESHKVVDVPPAQYNELLMRLNTQLEQHHIQSLLVQQHSSIPLLPSGERVETIEPVASDWIPTHVMGTAHVAGADALPILHVQQPAFTSNFVGSDFPVTREKRDYEPKLSVGRRHLSDTETTTTESARHRKKRYDSVRRSTRRHHSHQRRREAAHSISEEFSQPRRHRRRHPR